MSRYRKVGLVLIWYLVFSVLEDAISDLEREKELMVLPSSEPYEIQWQPTRQGVHTGSLVALLLWV